MLGSSTPSVDPQSPRSMGTTTVPESVQDSFFCHCMCFHMPIARAKPLEDEIRLPQMPWRTGDPVGRLTTAVSIQKQNPDHDANNQLQELFSRNKSVAPGCKGHSNVGADARLLHQLVCLGTVG